MGPRAGLDSVTRRNNHTACRKSNPGRPARSLATIMTGYPDS